MITFSATTTKQLAAVLLIGWTVGITGGCSSVRLTTADVIIMQGQDVTLNARVDGMSVLVPRSDCVVTFSVDGQVVGESTPDADGRVALRLGPAESSFSYEVSTRAGNRSSTTQADVYAWEPDRAIIAVDIDETICQTRYLDLLLGSGGLSEPLPDAQPALQRLADRYHIMYISARPQDLARKTRNWMASHGFPDGPLILADSMIRAALDQGGYKCRRLRSLKENLPGLVIGIGDKHADCYGFGRNKMLPVIISKRMHCGCENVINLPDWPAVAGLLDRSPPGDNLLVHVSAGQLP